MIAIPQSVTRRIPLKAYLSSDHVSAATAKTIAVVLSKNGAAFANPSAGATNATEIGSGWYYVDLSTTDTGTQGPIIIRGTGTGVDDVETYRHVADAHNAGFDALPSAVAAATGGIPTVDASNAVKVQSGTGANQISLSSGTVTVGTNSDKTGYSLSVTPPTAVQIRTEMDANSTKLANLDATMSSRSTYAGGAVASVTGNVGGNVVGSVASVTADVGITQTGADKVWNTTTRALTDKIGFALSSAGVQAIWDALTSALSTVGSIGKLLVTNIDTTTSSRSTYAGTDTAGTTTLLGRLTSGRAANLDNLDVATSTRSSHTAADVWAVTTRTLSTFGTLATDAATAVWGAASRTLSAFGFSVTASTVSDKTGYSLTTAYDPAKTAAQAGDAMALTGAYDAAKTALPASSYTAPDNTSIAAIKTKTDNLPSSPAAVADIPTAVQNADALLKRDWTSVTGEAARSALNALRFMRNKWSISGSTMTVTKEDDTTSAWTAAITTNSSQDPVSGADPS